MSEKVRNVIIIGSGPAGLTAAIYAARANLKPLCVEGFSAGGLVPGGQLMFTTDVENYPGFPEKVTGPELMKRFRDQAEHQGCELITADVERVDLSSRPFKVWVDGEDAPRLALSVILSTGARAKYLGLPSEQALINRGVSACAVCDGALYRGKPVAVVGGGDTAMEEASYLSGLCSSVALIHRRDEFRASQAMQQRVISNPRITVYYSTGVDEVLGVEKNEVTGLRLRDLKTDRTESIHVDAMFVAIGHVPLSELVRGQVDLHDNGYVKTVPGTTQTNIPGVFAAGDVQDFAWRQAVTAAGTGCMAALEAERWLHLHVLQHSLAPSPWPRLRPSIPAKSCASWCARRARSCGSTRRQAPAASRPGNCPSPPRRWSSRARTKRPWPLRRIPRRGPRSFRSLLRRRACLPRPFRLPRLPRLSRRQRRRGSSPLGPSCAPCPRRRARPFRLRPRPRRLR